LSQRLTLPKSFVIEEEEQLVLPIQNFRDDDRPTGGGAELVTLERRNRLGLVVEIVLGVKVGVAQKLEGGAMNLVRAALGGDVDLADAAAVLGLELPAFDLKLLERVEEGSSR